MTGFTAIVPLMPQNKMTEFLMNQAKLLKYAHSSKYTRVITMFRYHLGGMSIQEDPRVIPNL